MNKGLCFIVFVLLCLAVSCRVIRYNVPNITDSKIFPCRVVHYDTTHVFHFFENYGSNNLGKEIFVNDKALGMKLVNLDEFCSLSKTVSCLIIRHDSLLYNYHDEDYDENDIINPFSITKAFMTTLVGIALKQGKINSLDDKVSDYIPCYVDNDVGKVRVRQLLKHTSGIKFSDNLINPFAGNLKYYYGKHLRDYVTHLELYCEPGLEYNYNSANTQLLWAN